MLLRRITQHLKEQNWFAVALDFCIVVVGVGAALMAEQWIQDGQTREDLTRGEIGIKGDLYKNYFNVIENLAFEKCRRDTTQMIADALSSKDLEWQSLPFIKNKKGINSQFPRVVPGAYRGWGSHIWDSEFQKGTFDKMEPERRQKINHVFTITKIMEEKQDDIFKVQARLKALALAGDITAADRVRYFELLAYHDEISTLMEIGSQLIKESIEEIGFSYDKAIHDFYRDFTPKYNAEQVERYGECFSPIVLPFLEST
jgi:hypothetical protein